MKKKLCIVVSSSMTIKAFMINHLKVLSKEFEITVVMDEYINFQNEYKLSIEVRPINISREINLISDLKSLYKLTRFIADKKFDIVMSVTPKAGLIAMLSAFLNRTKIRIHFFTGQVWVTKEGLLRKLLKWSDRIIAVTSTHILVDSPSQRDFLIKEGIVESQKSGFLHKGSISGVDLEKFKKSDKLREELRNKYNISDELVFMFLGRLNRDKGIVDLAKVFSELLEEYQSIKLFLVGPEEKNIEEEISFLLKNKNVVRIGYVSNPQEILNIADVLVLPSYREGFGTIVIESAAMKIPTIGSNIYGLSDAIIDNQSGLLHEKGDLIDMKRQYEVIIHNRKLLQKYAHSGYERVVCDFSADVLSEALLEYLLEVSR